MLQESKGLMIKDVSAIAKKIEQAVNQFTDVAVVGTSGGVDSSVVGSVCVSALGKSNVHLVSMPYDMVDVETFNARSAELANRLGANHHIVSIGDASRAIEDSLKKIFLDSPMHMLTPANIRPRVRMTVLYGICGELGVRLKKRVRVMGTGHMSEDLIGYDTKGGDALADIFILSDLTKSEVYQLAQHYGVPKSIIDSAPSAGLYPGQTDLEELGFSYEELEPATLVIHSLIRSGRRPQDITPELPEFGKLERRHTEFVCSRYRLHFHKHQAPTTVDLRTTDPGLFCS